MPFQAVPTQHPPDHIPLKTVTGDHHVQARGGAHTITAAQTVQGLPHQEDRLVHHALRLPAPAPAQERPVMIADHRCVHQALVRVHPPKPPHPVLSKTRHNLGDHLVKSFGRRQPLRQCSQTPQRVNPVGPTPMQRESLFRQPVAPLHTFRLSHLPTIDHRLTNQTIESIKRDREVVVKRHRKIPAGCQWHLPEPVQDPTVRHQFTAPGRALRLIPVHIHTPSSATITRRSTFTISSGSRLSVSIE